MIQRDINNSNRGDVAPLSCDYCSLIIRALHEYKRKALLMKVGFCDILVWSLDTNKVREVAAMANFYSKKNPKSKRRPKGCIYGGRGGNLVALGGGVQNQP